MSAFSTLRRVECSFELGPEDRLRISGADARGFLHRVSASEVRDLDGAVARHLLFTDDRGGLVDAPLVTFEDGVFRVFAAPGRGADLRAWLEKWVIVDDVRIEADPEPAWLLGEPDLASGRALAPSTAAGPAIQSGTDPGAEPVSLAAWDAACFRAGRFFAGSATALRPNPLELGWKDAIAFDKGCYIGQEVIARMDTYDKVRRGLVTMSLSDPRPGGTPVSREGRKCGVVLCSVELDEGPFAWAVIDRTITTGAALQVEGGAAATVTTRPEARRRT